MTHLKEQIFLALFFSLILAGALITCSNNNENPVEQEQTEDGEDLEEQVEERVESVPDDQPAFDEMGIPLPHSKQLALGVAIPKGFKRVAQEKGNVTYRGLIPAYKVQAFYRKYLDCLEVEEMARGWKFKKATPKRPGDTSRSIDVAVLKRGRNRSDILVIDRMGRSKITPGKLPPTFEELRKAAHQGVKRHGAPIPGTY